VREQGEAPLAPLAAADGSRKYVGAAVIGLRERLRKRVAGMPGRAPKGIPIKKPTTQWIKPGLVGHVRFLKGEGGLRHAPRPRRLADGAVPLTDRIMLSVSRSSSVTPQLLSIIRISKSSSPH
jgi:hypothetical protein